MKYRIISIVAMVILLAGLTGCQTMQGHEGAAVGAGVGAAVGTAAGAVIGGSTKGAVIGGLTGALIGGAIGHYAYDKKKTREETARTYNYKPAQGTVLTIEEASLSSQTVKPGDVLEIKMTYAVLNPSPQSKVAITEIREITHDGELVGKPEVRVERSDGTYTSTVPLKLPSAAKQGQYLVRVTVQAGNVSDTKEIKFTVI